VSDVAARTDPGLVRERNEDRWLVRAYPGTTLLAVADGVGGEEGGEVASTAAIEALASAFVAPSYREVARSSLSVAVEAANTAVIAAAKDERYPHAATTLVAAAVRGRQAAIANLGDSRAYLVRGAAVRQITTDHSGDRASSITRFAGDPRGVQPDIFVEILEPGDRLVLCSDGLTRHVTDAEIGTAVASGSAKAADALVALARSRGGEDNVTVVVYAAGRPAPRALLGTLILLVLLLAAVAGALGVLLTAPVPASAPSPSPSPTASPTASPSESPAPSPTAIPAPTVTP
jgi:serine/threonine protein phosphatase PrpC